MWDDLSDELFSSSSTGTLWLGWRPSCCVDIDHKDEPAAQSENKEKRKISKINVSHVEICQITDSNHSQELMPACLQQPSRHPCKPPRLGPPSQVLHACCKEQIHYFLSNTARNFFQRRRPEFPTNLQITATRRTLTHFGISGKAGQPKKWESTTLYFLATYYLRYPPSR